MRVELVTPYCMFGVSWGATKSVSLRLKGQDQVALRKGVERLGYGDRWTVSRRGWELKDLRLVDPLPPVVAGMAAAFPRTLALPLLDALQEEIPEFAQADQFVPAWRETEKSGVLHLALYKGVGECSTLVLGQNRLLTNSQWYRTTKRQNGFRLNDKGNARWKGTDLGQPSPALLAALAGIRQTLDWEECVRLAAAEFPALGTELTLFTDEWDRQAAACSA